MRPSPRLRTASSLAFALTLAGLLSTGHALPPCSPQPVPCECPAGTSYHEGTTFAIIGANVANVETISGSFFNLSWIGGYAPESTNGPDKTVGSTRTVVSATTAGNYTFIEELIGYTVDADGSFRTALRQFNVPIPYNTTTGPFSGYWITYDARWAGENETSIAWTTRTCATGAPEDFAAIHEDGLSNITTLLRPLGKVNGNGTTPFSVGDRSG